MAKQFYLDEVSLVYSNNQDTRKMSYKIQVRLPTEKSKTPKAGDVSNAYKQFAEEVNV